MWLSAAKIGLAVLAGWVQGGLTPKETAAWAKIAPSLAYVSDHGKTTAVCVLIDDSGLFLADKDAIGKDTVEARLDDHVLTMKRVGDDGATGLVLLQASPWTFGEGHAAYLPEKPALQGQQLFIALPSGPIRGEFVRSDKVAVLLTSHRLFPMNELKFEAPESLVGGGLVFTQRGELIGALNATLPNQSANTQESRSASGFGSPLPPAALGGGGGRGASKSTAMVPQFMVRQAGPGDLTVAYTVGLGVMRRVVEGFKSPSHEVQHPSIGIYCKDSLIKGALVTRMREDSTAAKAGMQIGDIILSIDGITVKSQIGFASTMLQKEIGQTLVVWVLRNSMQVRLTIPVGKA